MMIYFELPLLRKYMVKNLLRGKKIL